MEGALTSNKRQGSWEDAVHVSDCFGDHIVLAVMRRVVNVL